MATKSRYQKLKARKRQNSNALKLVIHTLGWIGAAMLYYVAFSIFFDTPHEYELKRSSERLER